MTDTELSEIEARNEERAKLPCPHGALHEACHECLGSAITDIDTLIAEVKRLLAEVEEAYSRGYNDGGAASDGELRWRE